MKWNLRLAAVNRGIWKAGEMRQLLAEHGLTMSAGKMCGLWSGRPVSVKLDDLDVICAALGCQIGELLIPEPVRTVPIPQRKHAARVAGQSLGTVSRLHSGRTPPPR